MFNRITQERLYSYKDVCRILHTKTSYIIREAAARGEIRVIRCGRRVHFRESDLEDCFRHHLVGPADPAPFWRN